MVVNVTKTSQKMKQRSLLTIDDRRKYYRIRNNALREKVMT